MCGIAGIVGRISEGNRAALGRMNAAMAHRGPDGEGIWCSQPDGRGRGVMLAHRRLSILDRSLAGAQPMQDERSGDVLVFNGELYNYVELRRTLVDAGERFTSTGDAAVVLRALARDGTRAIAGFRGMYALAFFDVSGRRLMLARDPLGMKPLYLARKPDEAGEWSIAIASELRALLASGLLSSPRLNPRAVASVVWNGFVAGPDTAVLGVESLWPGDVAVFDTDGRETHQERVWPSPASRPADAADVELGPVLQDCVRLHLAADVPVCVFLSSGVDSSTVANLARRACAAPIHSFTLTFDEPEFDEGRAAGAIARAIGTEHRQVTLTESKFVAHLDAAVDSLDQPTFDGLNVFYMAQAVREAGFKVALVGTGGDELFGGYTSFRDLPVLHRLWRGTRLIPSSVRVRFAQLVAYALLHGHGGPVPPQTRWAKLPEMVRRGDDLLALYQLAYALFLPQFQEQLLCDRSHTLVDGLPPALRDRLAAETANRSARSAISVMERRLFLGERLLRDGDAASMAASVEMRMPLADRVLVEHVDRLPDGLRYGPMGTKALLRREGLIGLDPALFAGAKKGFVLPFERWIHRSLGGVMGETLRDPALVRPTGLDPGAVSRLWAAFQNSAPGVYWSRIWALYVLVRWCNRQGVYC